MKKVIVAVGDVDPGLIDPLYPSEGYDKRNRVISSAVFSIGYLSTRNQAEFSQPFSIARSRHSQVGFEPEIHEHDTRRKGRFYRIPNAYAQFRGAIGLIASHEHNAYPDAHHADVHITVRQSLAATGNGQLERGLHPDALPYEWKHVYVVSDCYPTEFPDHETHPYEVTFFNGTVEHCAQVVPEGTTRTFLRVIYTHFMPHQPQS